MALFRRKTRYVMRLYPTRSSDVSDPMNRCDKQVPCHHWQVVPHRLHCTTTSTTVANWEKPSPRCRRQVPDRAGHPFQRSVRVFGLSDVSTRTALGALA